MISIKFFLCDVLVVLFGTHARCFNPSMMCSVAIFKRVLRSVQDSLRDSSTSFDDFLSERARCIAEHETLFDLLPILETFQDVFIGPLSTYNLVSILEEGFTGSRLDLVQVATH